MCMIDDCDERASVWKERTQMARKDYRCEECGRAIHAGERYVYLFAMNYDGPFTGRWCLHCDVAKEWLWANCSGSMLTQVIEDCRAHVEKYGHRAKCIPALARICVGADRQWRHKYGPKAGQLMPVPKLPAKLEPAAHH